MVYNYSVTKAKGVLKMTVITKDALIGDILDAHPEVAPHLTAMGMHCLGCPSARGESLAQACMVHGVNVDEMIEKMNAEISKS